MNIKGFKNIFEKIGLWKTSISSMEHMIQTGTRHEKAWMSCDYILFITIFVDPKQCPVNIDICMKSALNCTL